PLAVGRPGAALTGVTGTAAVVFVALTEAAPTNGSPAPGASASASRTPGPPSSTARTPGSAANVSAIPSSSSNAAATPGSLSGNGSVARTTIEAHALDRAGAAAP